MVSFASLDRKLPPTTQKRRSTWVGFAPLSPLSFSLSLSRLPDPPYLAPLSVHVSVFLILAPTSIRSSPSYTLLSQCLCHFLQLCFDWLRSCLSVCARFLCLFIVSISVRPCVSFMHLCSNCTFVSEFVCVLFFLCTTLSVVCWSPVIDSNSPYLRGTHIALLKKPLGQGTMCTSKIWMCMWLRHSSSGSFDKHPNAYYTRTWTL